MNLLITPALPLTQPQRDTLLKAHTLYELTDERVPLSEHTLAFQPEEIEGVVCNFFFLHNKLDALPSLRFIQLTSAGMDRVPVDEIAEKGIALHNVGDAYAAPMAEWAVCKFLEICKRSQAFYKHQQDCLWQKERDILELNGMRAAIVGFGNVGRAIAKRLKPFGVTICAVDVHKDSSGLADEQYAISELQAVLATADALFLCVPLTPDTRHLLNASMLNATKPDAIIVNVSRGQVVDEQALIAHLQRGLLRGVALDVFENEPLPSDSPLWHMDRVCVTPHNSFVSTQNQEKLFRILVNNLDRFCQAK